MHPHKKESLDSATAKFKAMTSGYEKSSGSPSGNKPAPGVVDNGPMKEMPFGSEGAKSKLRLDKPKRTANPVATYARGGKVGKGKTDITINVGKPDDAGPMSAPMPQPVPVPVPAGPPPMAGPPPGAMPPPGAGPVQGVKFGGRTFKRGGKVGGFRGGAASGVGREEKAAHQAKRAKKKQVV